MTNSDFGTKQFQKVAISHYNAVSCSIKSFVRISNGYISSLQFDEDQGLYAV